MTAELFLCKTYAAEQRTTNPILTRRIKLGPYWWDASACHAPLITLTRSIMPCQAHLYLHLCQISSSESLKSLAMHVNNWSLAERNSHVLYPIEAQTVNRDFSGLVIELRIWNQGVKLWSSQLWRNLLFSCMVAVTWLSIGLSCWRSRAHNPGRTNTQGLYIIEEKELPLLLHLQMLRLLSLLG